MRPTLERAWPDSNTRTTRSGLRALSWCVHVEALRRVAVASGRDASACASHNDVPPAAENRLCDPRLSRIVRTAH